MDEDKDEKISALERYGEQFGYARLFFVSCETGNVDGVKVALRLGAFVEHNAVRAAVRESRCLVLDYLFTLAEGEVCKQVAMSETCHSGPSVVTEFLLNRGVEATPRFFQHAVQNMNFRVASILLHHMPHSERGRIKFKKVLRLFVYSKDLRFAREVLEACLQYADPKEWSTLMSEPYRPVEKDMLLLFIEYGYPVFIFDEDRLTDDDLFRLYHIKMSNKKSPIDFGNAEDRIAMYVEWRGLVRVHLYDSIYKDVMDIILQYT